MKFWKILLITLLVVYIILTLIITVSVVILYTIYNKNKIAVFNTFENKLFCNEYYCPNTILKINDIPKQITSKYQENMAQYVFNLISVLGSNKKELIQKQKGLDVIKKLYNSTEDKPFGVIFYDKANKTLFIIFRGTINIGEWMQDFDVSQKSYTLPIIKNSTKNKNNNIQSMFSLSPGNIVKIHSGFIDVYTKFRLELLNKVKIIKPSTIIVSGHSLGAAVATIVGTELYMKGYDTIIYNYASPKVGNEVFSKVIKDNSIPLYRHVNTSDIIPTLPPSVVPNLNIPSKPYFYSHSGKEITFTDNRFSYINNHILPCYKKYLFN
jgi:triacylglycerol lipase